MRPDAIAALGSHDLQRIARCLQAFADDANARCGLLLDRRGRPLVAFGNTDGLDETGFASLAAAEFEASEQFAGLLGGLEFAALYHHGLHGSMYLSDVAGVAILAAVFDHPTTPGMIRLRIRELVPRLEDILAGSKETPSRTEALDAGWGDDAATQIDRLFAG